MSKKSDRIHRQLEAYAVMAERCAICWHPKYVKKWGKTICLHHIVGRRGLDPHDHRNLLACCEDCHRLHHDGDSRRELTLGHILTAKLEEDGEEMFDLAFLAKLLRRAGLKEDPKPLPDWVAEERKANARLLTSRAPYLERGE